MIDTKPPRVRMYEDLVRTLEEVAGMTFRPLGCREVDLLDNTLVAMKAMSHITDYAVSAQCVQLSVFPTEYLEWTEHDGWSVRTPFKILMRLEVSHEKDERNRDDRG